MELLFPWFVSSMFLFCIFKDTFLFSCDSIFCNIYNIFNIILSNVAAVVYFRCLIKPVNLFYSKKDKVENLPDGTRKVTVGGPVKSDSVRLRVTATGDLKEPVYVTIQKLEACYKSGMKQIICHLIVAGENLRYHLLHYSINIRIS